MILGHGNELEKNESGRWKVKFISIRQRGQVVCFKEIDENVIIGKCSRRRPEFESLHRQQQDGDGGEDGEIDEDEDDDVSFAPKHLDR